jgi:hypothetical protein
MSKQANVAIQITVSGDGRNETFTLYPLQSLSASNVPPGATNVATPAYRQTVTIAGSGANTTITVPSGLTPSPNYCIISPSSNSVATKTLKQHNTDVGFQLILGLPIVLAVPAPAASWPGVVITSSSANNETWDVYWV